MKTIWKFDFRVIDDFSIEMPKGAVIRSVQSQFDVPCIWAEVDPEAEKEMRHFHLAGTGHTLPENVDDMTFLGTFIMHGGSLVFHLYEKGKTNERNNASQAN